MSKNNINRHVMTLLLVAVVLGAEWLSGCGKSEMPNTFTDTRDGNTYRTVEIGNQTWMAENLNYRTDSSWCYEKADSGFYCHKYGRLYSWSAATTACPPGWRLPDTADWWQLAEFADSARGSFVGGTTLKSTSGWKNNGNGTDDLGFSALPGGLRNVSGSFLDAGYYGYWWTAVKYGSYSAYYGRTDHDYNKYRDDVNLNVYLRNNGLSVRCVLGESKYEIATTHPTDTLTDNIDAKTFDTVRIYNQTWMRTNLNIETDSGSWCYKDSAKYCAIYGRLYTWEAAKKACPMGWRLPSQQEWQTLVDFAGGVDVAGKKLKSRTGWEVDYDGSIDNGTDRYRFTGLPGGHRLPPNSHRHSPEWGFGYVGTYGDWWTATEYSNENAYCWGMGFSKNYVSYHDFNKDYAFSVRCVRDD